MAIELRDVCEYRLPVARRAGHTVNTAAGFLDFGAAELR
jgi:hypothetical protein